MKKIKRILALLLVIFLIAMVFVTLYCAVTGSPYFMASLFVMLGLPLLICLLYTSPSPRDGAKSLMPSSA